MQRLKELREQKELSQVRLAQRADMNPATVWRIETGQRSPTIQQLERLAEALEVEVTDFFPKVQTSLPLEDEEQRRLHYLKPWADYINARADRVEHEIEQGHVTDLNWWQEFNGDVLALTLLYNRILPSPEEQTEDERLELLRLSEAVDRLNEVADEMDRAMEPVIAEMHKERYAKERERRKAALKVIHGRKSA